MKRPDQKGFTLLEVLLAVGLMVVVLSAVYTTFSVADKAYRAYRQYGVRLQQLRTLAGVLEKELRSAIYNEKDPFSSFFLRTKDYYDRKVSELEFTTLEGPRPPLRVRYFVKEQKDESLTLYKSITTVDGKEMSLEALEGLHHFTVEVVSTKEPLDVYDASKTHKLPGTLRVSIGIIFNDELMEISMTVKPRSEVYKW